MKTLKPIIIISILMIGFVQAGCMMHFNCTDGSGHIISETRELSSFEKIELEGSGNVYIKQGDGHSVKVETDDNLMEFIITKVEGSTLYLTTDGNLCPEKLNFYVYVNDLSGVKIEGSGDVFSDDGIKADEFEIEIQGSGDVKMELSANELECEIDGSGDIALKGFAGKTSLEVNGSGALDLEKFESESVSVSINGSGDCKIHVTKSLTARVNGSGDIKYTGNPENVNTSVNGSGDIIKY